MCILCRVNKNQGKTSLKIGRQYNEFFLVILYNDK